MNIIEIIEHKRDGLALTKGEIDYFINSLGDNTITDYQVTALLMAIVCRGMNDEETYHLTIAMANSGDTIDYKEYDITRVLDKHSTGGVGDTVSIVLVPLLAAMGYFIGKMSGRGLGLTGGTIDKLESIPGLSTSIALVDFIAQIKNVGCAIIGQELNLCPADKRLYQLRGASGTAHSIPLIAASIMSKKIALGATDIVVDVKCGVGAFVKNVEDCRLLGNTMRAIGAKCNINVDYIISDMNAPLSSYIGNSLELYGAIEVLQGVRNNLYELTCIIVDKLLLGFGVECSRELVDNAISSGAALAKLRDMVVAQSGDASYIDDPYKLFSTTSKSEVFANRNGYIAAIDADSIAKIVINMGGGRANKNDCIDHSVGVRLIKQIGDKVKIDEPIAELYYNEYSHIVYLKSLMDAIKIERNPVKYSLLLSE